MSGGKPVAVRKIDDHTVEFSFAEPYGLFLLELANPKALDHLFYQKAYLRAVPPRSCHRSRRGAGRRRGGGLARADGACAAATPTRRPRASPIRTVRRSRPGSSPTSPMWPAPRRVVMERNPYFWAVDSEGNQLPYIDRVVGQVYADTEAMVLGAISGNIDFGFRGINSPSNRPVLAANREEGDYQLFETPSIGGSPVMFYLNLTHKDDEYRALFNTRDFRVALSVGTRSAGDHRHGPARRRQAVAERAVRGCVHVSRALCARSISRYDAGRGEPAARRAGARRARRRRDPPDALGSSADSSVWTSRRPGRSCAMRSRSWRRSGARSGSSSW